MFERLKNDKKEVIYDKWEIAKKRYANNVRIIVEDAILENKFNITKDSLEYSL